MALGFGALICVPPDRAMDDAAEPAPTVAIHVRLGPELGTQAHYSIVAAIT